jgi:DNA-binding transcriptional regulator YiaG
MGLNEVYVNSRSTERWISLKSITPMPIFGLMETAIAAALVFRRSMKLSQAVFAERFGLPLNTLKQWEQGHRVPDTAADVLLRVIVADPDLVERIVREMRSGP